MFEVEMRVARRHDRVGVRDFRTQMPLAYADYVTQMATPYAKTKTDVATTPTP